MHHHEKENPAAVGTADGADIAQADQLAPQNITTAGERPHSEKLRVGSLVPSLIENIAAIPGAPAFALVKLAGCKPLKVRIAKLRSAKRFRNSVQYRLGIDIGIVPQNAWSAMIEPMLAAAKGGAS